MIDRSLYLPKAWVEDPQRCEKAGVPNGTEFYTKPQLARQMLQRAFQVRLPIKWVTGDSVYGSDSCLRRWLESKQQAYVLAVSAKESVSIGWNTYKVRDLATQTPEEKWEIISCGNGSKGPRKYEWIRYPLNCPDAPEWRRWLLIRRHRHEKDQLAYYIAYASEETNLEDLVQVAGTRWAVERCFQEAKGEVGLDQYEVRSWTGWYRHITLAMVAHAFLSVMRSKGNLMDPQKREPAFPKMNSLTKFKRGRGL